jgi:hypothetical protein
MSPAVAILQPFSQEAIMRKYRDPDTLPCFRAIE